MNASPQVVSHSRPSMGGTIEVAIAADAAHAAGAAEAACRTCNRIDAWAARLTRFSAESDLSALNGAAANDVAVRPTLAAALRWAALAEQRSDGVVDATMLEARLAAETDGPAGARPQHAWRLVQHGRTALVEREEPFRFDLDGVAKGWLADRAADLLLSWPSVAVDADGDIALRMDAGAEWFIEIADPRSSAAPALATLRLRGGDGWSRSYGVATSGTSVHRWQLADGRPSHHLIDRRTGRPAQTDVIQATVVAPSAREAEMIAKSAVILGSGDAWRFLERSAAHAAVLLLESGELLAMPGIEAWLA